MRVLPLPVCPLLHVVVLLPACVAAQAAERPNIIVIVADDPGCGEPGCHGGTDVPTPLNREMIERLLSPGGDRRTKQ